MVVLTLPLAIMQCAWHIALLLGEELYLLHCETKNIYIYIQLHTKHIPVFIHNPETSH